MFTDYFRGRILRDDPTKAHTLDRILRWANRWAEVRYRYLNHYLRDDPDHWQRLEQRGFRDAGDHANEIVHTSSIQDDCLLAESKWFNPIHRSLFFDVYRLGVRESRRLGTYLDIGLPSHLNLVLTLISSLPFKLERTAGVRKERILMGNRLYQSLHPLARRAHAKGNKRTPERSTPRSGHGRSGQAKFETAIHE
ncbi:hypothetical protein F5Y11DRAFT_256698 [Daldinia sp. FL1419]|nr:hypothetical protein F5Y11DRAFT_256698 [Daldinia sp. FL1419]